MLCNCDQFIRQAASFDGRCPLMNCDPVAPPGFCNRGEVRYGSIGGLEFEVPQSRLYCLWINVAHCSTALQCICRVIPKKFHDNESTHILHNFGRPPIGGSFPPPPLAAPLLWSVSATDKAHKSVAIPNYYTQKEIRGHSVEGGAHKIIGNESVPIQLAQCWFPGLVISNAKI